MKMSHDKKVLWGEYQDSLLGTQTGGFRWLQAESACKC